MTDELSLNLHLIEHTAATVSFALVVCNQSHSRLAMPWPETPCLEFRRVADGKLAEWYTRNS